MKSKIKFDIDESTGNPAISISYFPSDDIRDKLVGQFINNTQMREGNLTMESSEFGISDPYEHKFVIKYEE